MSKHNAPPLIFDDRVKPIRRERAQRRSGRFLVERCAQDAAERLQDINRRFERALIIGHADFQTCILNALPEEKRPLEIFTDMSDVPLQSVDVVLSLLELQSENDPIGALVQMRQRLKADGLLIAAMFGGDNLTQLRQAFYVVDQDRFGGISPRIYPYADDTQAAGLLARAGLALPVVDKDMFTVKYAKLETLIADIRDLGDMNSLIERSRAYLGRDIYANLVRAYPRAQDKDKFPVKFEILWLTGWSPHKSQQTPLKPGSAKMRLADALKTSETKL